MSEDYIEAARVVTEAWQRVFDEWVQAATAVVKAWEESGVLGLLEDRCNE